MSHSAHVAKISAFVSWFTTNGGYINPLTEFVHSPDRGIYLHAKPTNEDPIPPGTLVISCPHALSISALNALDTPPYFQRNPRRAAERPAPALPDAFCSEAKGQTVAAVWLCVLWLLRQKNRDQVDFEGPYDAYLDILPQVPLPDGESSMKIDDYIEVIDTPMWWSENEISWLAGSHLENGVRDMEEDWKAQWNTWGDVITTWSATHGLNISWRLFKWALTIFGTRSFGPSVASPVMTTTVESTSSSHSQAGSLYAGNDMLNHSASTSNRWFRNDTAFGILCDDKTRPGKEVFTSYGPKSNTELLLSFGFCLMNNPHDSFDVKLPQRDRPIPIFETIRQAGFPDPESNSEPQTSDDGTFSFSQDGTFRPNHPPVASYPELRHYCVRSLQNPDVSNVPSPGYGDSTSIPYAPWISNIPEDLLNEMTVELANRRETSYVQEKLDQISTKKLYQAFGGRNITYVGLFLYDRFEVDERKILMMDPVKNSTAFPISIDSSTSTVEDRRRYYSRVYCTSKIRIVREIVAALARYLESIVAGTVAIPRNAETSSSRQMLSSPTGAFPLALTLPQAINCLQSMGSDIYTSFMTAVIDILRLDDMDSEEGRLEGPWQGWKLWLGVVLAFTHELRLKHTTSPAATASNAGPEDVQGLDTRILHPALHRWCDFVLDIYRPYEPADPSNIPPSTEEESSAAGLSNILLKLRQVSPQNQLWAAQLWPPSFVMALGEILEEETLEIPLRALRRKPKADGKDTATVLWVFVK